VTSSHCGLDGISLGYSRLTAQSPAQDWVVSNSRFEYNARLGMAWVGGIGLVVTNCKFNHTGRGSFFSKPGWGLDIEAENSVIRRGRFVSCDFVNNHAGGMVADTGDSADVTFTDCLFWGTTEGAWSIWPRKPGFRFYNCRIYGTALKNHGSPDPDKANQFHNCHFEDYEGSYEGKTYSSYRYGYLVCFQFGGENVLLDGCTLVANKTASMCLNSGAPKIVRNCQVHHNWAEASDKSILCQLANVYIENTRFHEKLGRDEKEFSMQIDSSNVTVGPGVVVDGPQCSWGKERATGTIERTEPRQ
ncbi:MAG: right-handed parallel beta-helix repeat-containing protein, partial [Verrucomicrobiia bacterium]